MNCSCGGSSLGIVVAVGVLVSLSFAQRSVSCSDISVGPWLLGVSVSSSFLPHSALRSGVGNAFLDSDAFNLTSGSGDCLSCPGCSVCNGAEAAPLHAP
ncbi:hypothetical protein NDU88_009823 [Pleurodeles waltl]|uniref:Secreted protein n=1 Tax=Pleurodeles waltl TaxID=8319 RepID=A0AAV7QWG8_PLEWA|nr:hypothetical protein NDU88_009823 [Pleurodeles waltl]